MSNVARMIVAAACAGVVVVAASVASGHAMTAGSLLEYTVNYDGSDLKQLGGIGPVLTAYKGPMPPISFAQYNLRSLSRSRNGDSFAFIDQEALYTGSSDPVSPEPFVRATPVGLSAAPVGEVGEAPAFSPDGTQIAFTVNFVAAGNAKAVDTVAVDGSNLRQAVNYGHDPSWSPDGRWLAFVSGVGRVMVVRSDGVGAPRRIAVGHTAAFSPRANLIAFVHGATISVIRSDGSGLRTIARDAYTGYQGSRVVWSADGAMLAWSSRAGIDVSTLTGRSWLVARRTRNAVSQPASFSPDGKHLAFRGDGLYTVAVGAHTEHRALLVASDPVPVDAVRWTSNTRLTYLTISSD